MASVVEKSNAPTEEDEEDLEALRLAALMTLRKKSPQNSPPPNVIFQPHRGNPNLIAIVPEGADPPAVVIKKSPRQNFFRHPPSRQQQFRQSSKFGTALKVLPQVKLLGNKTSKLQQKKEDDKGDGREEVSTKFSRFEDTESESEEESDTEKNESESSEESEDVIDLEDDDSLEALMAQMEHEIKSGIDVEPNKKDKKKVKSGKSKEKEAKVRSEENNVPDKIKSETKTAVVEPTLKDNREITTTVENEESKRVKSRSPEPVGAKSPAIVHPLNIIKPVEDNINSKSPKNESPVIVSEPTIKQRSHSPSNSRCQTPPRSPQRARSPTIRIVMKARSPIKQMSRSPRNSPVRSKSPIARSFSPSRRKSPSKFSPERKSPGLYYSRNRSPSPYYKAREEDFLPAKRPRSPPRRRSFSPRRGARELSPKYYQRRSRSPLSPVYRSPSPRYRSRSPVRRRSVSPKNRKYTKSSHSPASWGTPKRRSPSLSPRRSRSPPRKREFSPRRRQTSPRREMNYRRNSVSPKRKSTPPYKKYSPPRSPKHKQRSPSPRKNGSPRRRNPSPSAKEIRPKVERRSRTPSLSLSPSPPRESKDSSRRYKSPLRTRKEPSDNTNNRLSRTRRGRSLDRPEESKERRKPNNKTWERDRDGRQWNRKGDGKKRERTDRNDRESRRERENNRAEKQKREEPKENSINPKVSDNPVFEARRKKFESTAVVEPAGKKIRLANKKDSPKKERTLNESKKVKAVEEKKIVEDSAQPEEDFFSGREEIDDIDSFLNEDVLDLSAEVWSSDDDLFPKVKKSTKEVIKSKPPAEVWSSDEDLIPKVKKSTKEVIKSKPPVKQRPVKERISLKNKARKRKSTEKVSNSSPEGRTSKNKIPPVTKTLSPAKRSQWSPEVEQEEERKDRDDSDLRAELSRRREERLTKAGSLHEKLPARLLQSAFESALGTKKSKKEEKAQKSEKESKNRDKESGTPPVHKEKSDGRRVLVLKRPGPVRMQSAHINVTFPKDRDSGSESSYSSSSSDDRYTSSKRKLPVYMRLGTAQQKRSGGRKVKLRTHRSQV